MSFTIIWDRGKNYHKDVKRGIMGNEEFARLLVLFKEKKHEAPVDWEHEFSNLSETLLNKAYHCCAACSK